ncbi:preprotein translocase subunit [Corynebacterium pilosum]|uniref:Putative membrane protein insertion efficiency factor n=2 Tax=Corynebacterium pilosum TaxID=35756 RepID=A0A376CL88_9CORY|nr:preprotein translocase subunit [Corynebacterium pilosum]
MANSMSHRNIYGEEIPEPKGLGSRGLVRLVRVYQKYISSMKMYSTCRFEPTCSAYALEAISRRGAITGTVLAITRLVKCGPWHPGGIDPVPRSE